MNNQKYFKANINIALFLVAFLFLISSFIETSLACSRVLYVSDDNSLVLTGRTTDWAKDSHTNLWAFPRGIERNGMQGKKSIKWKSKYGSVISSVYDMFPIDGMNEKGLVMNILRLKEAVFLPKKQIITKKNIHLTLWGQYMLDNFASVDEAVNFIEKEKFYVFPIESEESSGVHLSMSDSSGDSAIIEYIDGELKVYHNKKYKVLTNSPDFSKQLAINDYWKKVGGYNFLPGSVESADRFVRGSFYIDKAKKTSNKKEAMAITFSIIRNLSGPLGILLEDGSSDLITTWRVLSDQTNKIYYFESVFELNAFSVDLNKMDFENIDYTRKLNLRNNQYYSGEVSKYFIENDSFNFKPDIKELEKNLQDAI